MIKVQTRGLLRWFVVFSSRAEDAKPIFLHRLFTSREWSHVWAYAWDPDTGIYLTIDPIGNNLIVDPVPVLDHPNAVLREVCNRKETRAVVLYGKQSECEYGFKFHGFHTCVTVIKDLLGINSLSIQTPKGLYYRLIKSGGMVLYPETTMGDNHVGNVLKSKNAGHISTTKTNCRSRG